MTKLDWAEDKAIKLIDHCRYCAMDGLRCKDDYDNQVIAIAAALREIGKERDMWRADAETFKSCWNAACHDIDELKRQIVAKWEK